MRSKTQKKSQKNLSQKRERFFYLGRLERYQNLFESTLATKKAEEKAKFESEIQKIYEKKLAEAGLKNTSPGSTNTQELEPGLNSATTQVFDIKTQKEVFKWARELETEKEEELVNFNLTKVAALGNVNQLLSGQYESVIAQAEKDLRFNSTPAGRARAGRQSERAQAFENIDSGKARKKGIRFKSLNETQQRVIKNFLDSKNISNADLQKSIVGLKDEDISRKNEKEKAAYIAKKTAELKAKYIPQKNPVTSETPVISEKPVTEENPIIDTRNTVEKVESYEEALIREAKEKAEKTKYEKYLSDQKTTKAIAEALRSPEGQKFVKEILQASRNGLTNIPKNLILSTIVDIEF